MRELGMLEVNEVRALRIRNTDQLTAGENLHKNLAAVNTTTHYGKGMYLKGWDVPYRVLTIRAEAFDVCLKFGTNNIVAYKVKPKVVAMKSKLTKCCAIRRSTNC